MEIILFQDKQCYKAYKVFKKDMRNFKNNFTYEVNKLYSCIDVDTDITKDCSYGLHLFDNPTDAQWFMLDGIVYLCYVPVENNMVTFIPEKTKFRCKQFYLTSETVTIDLVSMWNSLTDYQKTNLCCRESVASAIFNTVGWNNLTDRQKIRLCCRESAALEILKLYWDSLTEYQKNSLCRCKSTAPVILKLYWDSLTEYQKNSLCNCESVASAIFHKVDWNNQTEYQKDILRTKIVIMSDAI